jgi:hypothetical protein
MEHLQSTILIDILVTFCSGILYFFMGMYFSVKRNHYKKLQNYEYFYEDKVLIRIFIWIGCVLFPVIHVLMLVTLFILREQLIWNTLNVSTLIGIAYMILGLAYFIWFLRRRKQTYIFNMGNILIFPTRRFKPSDFKQVDFTRSNFHFFLSYLDDGKISRRVKFRNRPDLEKFFQNILPKKSFIHHKYTSF